MRSPFAAALVFLSATSAFSHGAFSVGFISDGSGRVTRSVGSLARNFATKDLAIQGADRQCAELIFPGETFAKPCHVVMIFHDQCLAVSRVRDNNVAIHYQLGASDDESRENSRAICQADSAGAACFVSQSACDVTSAPVAINVPIPTRNTTTPTDESLLDHFIRSTSGQFSTATSWWHDNVTSFVLIALSAILVLSAALVYTFRKLRRIQRMVTTSAFRSKPTPDQWRPKENDDRATGQTILPTGEAVTFSPSPKSSNDRLDAAAIKDAFKDRRQEFDI
jgi:hypothetical protein